MCQLNIQYHILMYSLNKGLCKINNRLHCFFIKWYTSRNHIIKNFRNLSIKFKLRKNILFLKNFILFFFPSYYFAKRFLEVFQVKFQTSFLSYSFLEDMLLEMFHFQDLFLNGHIFPHSLW